MFAALLFLVAAILVSANELECKVCEYVVNYADSKLQANATIAEVESFVENEVCNRVPTKYQSTCDDIIESYGSDVINAVTNYETPTRLCGDQLHFCATDSDIEGVEDPIDDGFSIKCVFECGLEAWDVYKDCQAAYVQAGLDPYSDFECADKIYDLASKCGCCIAHSLNKDPRFC